MRHSLHFAVFLANEADRENHSWSLWDLITVIKVELQCGEGQEFAGWVHTGKVPIRNNFVRLVPLWPYTNFFFVLYSVESFHSVISGILHFWIIYMENYSYFTWISKVSTTGNAYLDFFCDGICFAIKRVPFSSGHNVLDYDESQRNVMTTTMTCLCQKKWARRRAGAEMGQYWESKSHYLVARLQDCGSRGVENEGVNRSDYQGGLMALTVPIWQANSTLDR